MADEWVAFAEQLASSYSVYIYDRRGCGQSSPPVADQAIDAEVDDLAAMVRLAGPGAAVLGHSFGGGCALSYAARGGFDGQLLLYEPRHSARQSVSREEVPAIERLIQAGDRDGAVEHVMRHVVKLSDEAIGCFRSAPQWERMCALVQSFPNEVRLLDSLRWQPGDLDAIVRAPTLLVGESSPVASVETCWNVALCELMPSLRVVEIPGQGHFAYLTDPAVLARVVADCLCPNKEA